MTERPPHKMPSLTAASLRVFDLSLGEMLWSRRTVFLALVVGGPVLIAIILRVVDALNVPAMRVNGVRLGGPSIFGLMLWFLFLRFIVPVLGIFYGTALMADEVEDKTITYLFTRPIPRSAVLIGKYLAYLASTVLIVLPSVMLVYFLVVPDWRGCHCRDLPDAAARPGAAGHRAGGLRGAVCRRGGLDQAPGAGWPFLRLRLGELRPGAAGLHEALHRGLLHPESRAPRHAAGQLAVDSPVGLQGQCLSPPGHADPHRAPGGRPGRWPRGPWNGGNTCWSNRLGRVSEPIFGPARITHQRI